MGCLLRKLLDRSVVILEKNQLKRRRGELSGCTPHMQNRHIAATKINPRVREYMVFCHSSEEAGHKAMLEALNATPLLQLNMRLGEGTGAALAMNLLYAAENFYNNMASFDNAGIDAV